MLDMREYSRPVHRSLLTRELILGVPQVALLVIFLTIIIFVYLLRMIFMLPVCIGLYFVMRHLTKKDIYFVDILFNSVTEKDLLAA